MSDARSDGLQPQQAIANEDKEAADALVAELNEVRALLDESLNDLYSPLLDLARAHLRDMAPYLRAAVVLATGVPAPDTAEARRKRMLLGAALEMLAVALSIHDLLLLERTNDESLDKSLLGSVILTGDYCFSRAAVLAAGTDNPRVVEIFAQALKVLSEGKLRHHFATHPAAQQETGDAELRRAGAEAAAELSGLPGPGLAAAAVLAENLPKAAPLQREDTAALPTPVRERWIALATLYAAGRL